ncbi:MAG: NUDIX hydrolase [Patescibacteria group bacterium]|nr:NUDIX hydrolase [Patescibacteria group bacterium]
MSKKPIVQKIVLAAVIMKNDKVLILQRNKDEDIFPNMWELPSGKRESLENSESCLLREVKEETGLDVEIIMPFYIFDYQIEKPEEIRDSTQINFLVKSVKNDNDNNKIRLSFEHQNFAWISEDDIDKYRLSEATKKVIQEAFELIRKLNVQT